MSNRIIKESICTSDTILSLTPEEEVTFYRLIVNCDDYGRFDGRPSILASRLYPLRRDYSENQIAGWMNALIRAGLVQVYFSGDRPYLQITNWEEHQTIRNKRSKYPDPGRFAPYWHYPTSGDPGKNADSTGNADAKCAQEDNTCCDKKDSPSADLGISSATEEITDVNKEADDTEECLFQEDDDTEDLSQRTEPDSLRKELGENPETAKASTVILAEDSVAASMEDSIPFSAETATCKQLNSDCKQLNAIASLNPNPNPNPNPNLNCESEPQVPAYAHARDRLDPGSFYEAVHNPRYLTVSDLRAMNAPVEDGAFPEPETEEPVLPAETKEPHPTKDHRAYVMKGEEEDQAVLDFIGYYYDLLEQGIPVMTPEFEARYPGLMAFEVCLARYIMPDYGLPLTNENIAAVASDINDYGYFHIQEVLAHAFRKDKWGFLTLGYYRAILRNGIYESAGKRPSVPAPVPEPMGNEEQSLQEPVNPIMIDLFAA
ncbi:MAG: hypothetical protein IJ719_02565 [Clostridia bacterium]|nr:hypothetical protein [Clostridia bacterium]